MNVDEMLDFDDNVDFNFSEGPQNTSSNFSEVDGIFDLDSEINFATSVQLTEEEKSSIEGKTKKDSELTNNQLSENIELDNNSALSQQKDQELKFDDFDMDDPDFLNDYGGNTDDVTIEDDEFWKELGLDPPNEVKEEGEKPIEESGTSENLETDIKLNENTQKRLTSSQSDDIKVNSTISSNKSVKGTSKSPEKEDGEILNASASADNNRQGQQQSQKQKLSQSQQQIQTQRQAQTQRTQTQRQQQQNNLQQQNLQNYRGRRRNDWRPINNNNSFLNSGMSSFRPGFGPGLEGMPGMQIPLNNPPMLPNLNVPPGIIGPNIHVNPNFARLRPHTLPFGNHMNQYPMGSGGPPMNMMPYQGQMDMHPYPPSMTPMASGRGNNNSYGGRGGSPGFNHNSVSPRRPINPQSNNQTQRPMQPSPKRKVPNDGFDQKEPESKKISVTNGKSPVPDAKSASASQKNVEKNKAVSSPATKNSSSPPAVKTSNPKQGPSIANTNKTASAAAKNKIVPASSNTSSSSTSAKQTPKPMQKSTPKNTRNAPAKADTTSSPTSKSTAKTDNASSSGGNKLTIKNVVKNVTKRDIQDLANKVPIGFSSITFDRSAQTAEVVFESSEGAKMFRRMHNRSLLYGSNIVINFS